MADLRSARTTAEPASRMPAAIWSMISSGGSPRGLSEVRKTRSARSSATRPMRGRFPLSRSPPQPKRQRSLPRVNSRAVRRTVSRPAGV